MRSVGEQGAVAHPYFGEGFEIVFVRACDGILTSALHSQFILTGGTGTDFFDKRGVDQHRAVNSNEAIGAEFIGSR